MRNKNTWYKSRS